MTTVYAQAAGEYAGASSVAAAVVERFNSAYITVSISISEHPMLWGVGVVVVGWLLLRPRR